MKSIFVSYMLICSVASVVLSQEAPPGMNAAAQLRFGIGADALGLGSAFTAIARGPSALYWNPAALVEQTPSVSGMYTEPFGGIGEIGYRIQYLGFVYGTGTFGYGLGWFNSHVSDIPLTDAGGSFDYDSSIYFVSFGLSEEKQEAGFKIAVGATAKVYHDVMLEGSALGVGFDLGFLLDLGGLRIAYCGQDIGNTRYRWHGTGQEPLVFVPWVHRLGISARLWEGLVLGAVELVYEPGELVPFLWRFGIEVSPTEWLDLRAGVRLDPFGESYYSVFTLGLGISPWGNLKFDYAYLINPLPAVTISTSTHVFSVQMSF